jgi:hypothetical protein
MPVVSCGQPGATIPESTIHEKENPVTDDSVGDFHSKDAEDEAHGASAKADESVTGGKADEIDPEAEKAAEGLTVSDRDSAAYKKSLERGAAQKGEGAI